MVANPVPVVFLGQLADQAGRRFDGLNQVEFRCQPFGNLGKQGNLFFKICPDRRKELGSPSQQIPGIVDNWKLVPGRQAPLADVFIGALLKCFPHPREDGLFFV